MKTPFALLLAMVLAACGKGENAPGPGGVTAGEARALDEAAEMIEQRRLPPAALRPPAAPAEGPDQTVQTPDGARTPPAAQ